MVILKDVSLCSIVRDEKMNPAGGIQRFIESHVPFVEEAVIVDTGSVDGTREILEEMQSVYSNLKVIDIPFTNFSDSRNESLKYIQTKRVLVLDADELITKEKPSNNWKYIQEELENNPSDVYILPIEEIYFNGLKLINNRCNSLRLFNTDKGFYFKNKLWETLEIGDKTAKVCPRVFIRHFLPPVSGSTNKMKKWYLDSFFKIINVSSKTRENHWMTPPSKIQGFEEWKRYNELRKDYI